MSMWRNVGESFSILGFSSWQQGHFKIGLIEYWSQVVLNKFNFVQQSTGQMVVQIAFWGQKVLVLNGIFCEFWQLIVAKIRITYMEALLTVVFLEDFLYVRSKQNFFFFLFFYLSQNLWTCCSFSTSFR
eukprot:TRINITY_DN12253_c0_g1_i7.p1 TRINITY_DN12253_c0_g1~~TRINITY_DN12253_c0_g1_i7.p1  ORF type:complete len:129 (-),score=0.58 TRINITY_DN12253_c0_g1_i7:32-418(-)